MKNRIAACLVIAAIKSHIALQTTSVKKPMEGKALLAKLISSQGLDENQAQTIATSGLEWLTDEIDDPQKGSFTTDKTLEHLTAMLSANMNRRSPEDDALTTYLKAPPLDKDRARGLAADIEMQIENTAERIAAAALERETIAPPKRDEYQPLRRESLNKSSLRALDFQIEKATGGQIKTGADMMERLIQDQETIANLKAAVLAANSSGRDAPASAGAAPLQSYVFTSKVMDVKKVIPMDRIAATQTMMANNVAKLQLTVWASDPPHPQVPAIDERYVFDAHTLATVVYCLENGKNYAIVGPTGCGKTTFMEQVAARTNRPFYRIPIDGEMRRKEIIGGFKQQVFENGPATVWYDGLLTEAIRYPSVIDLDEFDRGDPDLMYAAHQALERKGIIILEDSGRYIPMHRACSVGATANTKGRADGNGLYANVTELSEASRDRFPFWIDHDYLEEDKELDLIVDENPTLSRDNLARIAKIAVDIRLAFKSGSIRTACSTRQVQSTAAFATAMSQIMREPEALRYALGQVLIARGVDDSDANAIREIVNQRLG